MKRTLFLTIKKVWLDKILSGEKNIEYREYKEYYHKKFCNVHYDEILLQAGYSKNSPRLQATIKEIKIGTHKSNELFGFEINVYEIHLTNVKRIQ